ncbi:hypothetical protein ABEU20_000655 [Rhodococcus sp. PAM 2766]|uniref:Uncharacterized protein n=1 Tax=Rhodococcus parequi TaxID=3137122 RepID=A0ABW9F9C4_9NOCA
MAWNLARVLDFKDSANHKKFTVKIEPNGPYRPVEHTHILIIDDYRTGARAAAGTQKAVEKMRTTLDKANSST